MAASDRTSRAARNAQERATKTLLHYFSLLAERTGAKLDAECLGEIEEAVDDLVNAAVTEAQASRHA